MQRAVAQLILAALAGAASPALAADIAEYMGRFAVMNPELEKKGLKPPGACSEERTKDFWKVLAGLHDEWERGSKLRGKASLGFQGDDARPYGGPADSSNSVAQGGADQYTVTAGLKLRRGTYPGEFKFDAGIDVRLQGNTFEQNVRELFVAYDHWMNPLFEAFVFGNQFSDSFMGIDQRYEVGAGVFVGPYFGHTSSTTEPVPLLSRGLPRPDELELWKDDLKHAKERLEARGELAAADPSWLRCYAAVLGDTNDATKQAIRELEALFKDIDNQWLDAHNAQTQRNARFRLGVAFSVFGELEHATLKYTPIDTLAVGTPSATTQRTPVSLPVPATQRYRWVVRPTFEFRPNRHWEFTALWYFKLPLNDTRTTIPGEAESRYDYRYDLDVTGGFTVSEKEIGQPGNVTVEVRYRRVFDKVPPFYQPGEGANAAPFLIAPDTHTRITLNFGIKW